MSKINFSQGIAKALERFYGTRDVVAQRAATMDALNIQPGEAVLDLGCGPGYLCEDLANATGPQGRVLGLDISADLIALCEARPHADWLDYNVSDATALPLPDAQFDVVACTQVAEYIPDVPAVLSEIYRTLKPGGRVLIVATDWDTVAWHSEDPERMSKVMRAWEAHCAHPRLPRKLAPLMRQAGFEVTSVKMFPLINIRYEKEAYSYGISKMIRDFVIKGKHLAEPLTDAWFAEMASLDKAGHYYFTSARMFFSARKPNCA